MAEYKYPFFLHAICVSTMFCSGRRGRGVQIPDLGSSLIALPEKTVFFSLLFSFFLHLG